MVEKYGRISYNIGRFYLCAECSGVYPVLQYGMLQILADFAMGVRPTAAADMVLSEGLD